MVNTNTGLPGIPSAPLVDKAGLPTPLWWQFFLNLWRRTGGSDGSPSLILDIITDVAGSILYRGAAAWQGLNPAPQYKVLRMGAAFPEWDTLDGNSFGSQPAGYFFKSPAAAPGPPSLQSPLGQYPATASNDDAVVGNIGEYISGSAAGVVLASGVISDIKSISLPPGNWIVWGIVETVPAGGTTTSIIQSWINTASATDPGFPNGGAYQLQQQAIAAGLSQIFPVGSIRIKVPAGPNQTVYLSTDVTFAAGAMTASGFLAAIRPR